MSASMLGLLQEAIAVIALGIGAYQDVRERAVSNRLIVVFMLAESVLLVIRILVEGLPRYWHLYAAIDAITVIALLVLVLACLKGPGDLLMYLGALLSNPWGAPLLPASLILLLYYSIYSLAPLPYNLARNLLSSAARRELAKLPLLKRISRLFTAQLLPAERLAKKGSWWIPLDVREASRSVCSVEVNPWDVVSRALKEGRVKPGEMLWATYGIPALVPLLAAYVTLILAGDTPVTLLLSHLLHA